MGIARARGADVPLPRPPFRHSCALRISCKQPAQSPSGASCSHPDQLRIGALLWTRSAVYERAGFRDTTTMVHQRCPA